MRATKLVAFVVAAAFAAACSGNSGIPGSPTAPGGNPGGNVDPSPGQNLPIPTATLTLLEDEVVISPGGQVITGSGQETPIKVTPIRITPVPASCTTNRYCISYEILAGFGWMPNDPNSKASVFVDFCMDKDCASVEARASTEVATGHEATITLSDNGFTVLSGRPKAFRFRGEFIRKGKVPGSAERVKASVPPSSWE